MPANEELALIAKILDKSELRPVLEANIHIDDFHTVDGIVGFKHLLKYHRGKKTFGQVPTRDLYLRKFPTHVLPPPSKDSLEGMVLHFKTYTAGARLGKIVDTLPDYYDDPEKAVEFIQKELKELNRSSRVSRDVVLSESMKGAVNDYMTRKNQEGYLGIPYPWEVLNEETGGMLAQQFIVFFGRPKSMKTWVMLHCATNAYNYHNRRVLIYTREMSEEQMRDRCICLLIGAPYSAYRRGTLHKFPSRFGGTMEDRFIELAEMIQEDEKICRKESGYNKGLIITSDRDDPKGGGVEGIRQKARDWQPDLICVDGIYLLRNDRSGKRSVDWKEQYAISQDLKDVAQECMVPLIGTTQANRDGKDNFSEGSEDFSFADSVGMDTDLSMRLMKKRTENPDVNKLAVIIKVAREINMYGFAINGNAATNFDVLQRKAQTRKESSSLTRTLVSLYGNRSYSTAQRRPGPCSRVTNPMKMEKGRG